MRTTTTPVAEHSEVLERLYQVEYVGMVRLAFTLVGNNAEAEDLVQDSFVEVSRRLDEIRKPGAYLRSAVVSRCKSSLRRRRVMEHHRPEPPAGLASDAGELWDVLDRLPEDQRIAVVLRYYGGYRASEIRQDHRHACCNGAVASTKRTHSATKGAGDMNKFTERVEHDLSQIADRATPSSTAWESIQQRIAEQTTEPTMEVIMLNPDQKKPPTVSRTWMAVAAALILVVGIGGLIALLNRDDGGDIDTVDTPEVTVPLELDSEPEPDVIVPDDGTDAELGADAESPTTEQTGPIAMTGDVIADCEGGDLILDDDPNQLVPLSCVFRDTSVVPFAAEQEFIVTFYQQPFHLTSAGPFRPISAVSDSGFMYAGYIWDGQPEFMSRFVGVADGVGPYEGMLITMSGREFNAEDAMHFQWVAGDDLSALTISGTDVEAEEVTADCTIVGFVEDSDGDPETEQFNSVCSAEDGAVNTLDTYLFGPAVNTLGVGSNRFVITPGSSINAGFIPRAGGPTITVGIEEGTGVNEGLLLHRLTIGTITEAGDSTSTTVQVALPPAE